MATTEKLLLGTQATVLNTGATLANNALALSAAFNNVQGGGGGDGYIQARLTFAGTFGTAPSGNTGLSVWLLTSEDAGASYEDGGASVTPTRAPDLVLPLAAINTAQQLSGWVLLPPGFIKVLLKNDGTGQTLNSGWTLKLLPITRQAV